MSALLQKYKAIFSSKPGVAKGVEHSIDTGNVRRIAVTPYRITGPYMDKIHTELNEMLKANIITPSMSPWAAPIGLVDKPDRSVRFWVDYRKLNHVTKVDAYPMP